MTPIPAMKKIIEEESLNPYLVVHPDVEGEFPKDSSRPENCVILADAMDNFNYRRMNGALNVLQNHDMRLFSLGMGKYYRHGGCLCFDVGAYASMLSNATGHTV